MGRRIIPGFCRPDRMPTRLEIMIKPCSQGRHDARATNLTCVWPTRHLGSRRVDLRLLHVLEIWLLGCRLYIDTYVEIAQIRGYLRQQRTIKTYNFHIDKSTLILHKTEFRVLYIEYIRKHSYYRRMGPITLARRGGKGGGRLDMKVGWNRSRHNSYWRLLWWNILSQDIILTLYIIYRIY